MPKSHPQYPAEYRQRLVEFVRAGMTPGELSRQFEPSTQTIRNWIVQTDRDEGKRSDGLTSAARV